jgi:uncharacterized BrkB/YihY/UPF0761 family membrane protein
MALRRAQARHLHRPAASISFYALFSLPALLVAAIHLAGQVYGAAGSLVVLLVWVYASSLSVLLGGTFAFAWEEVRGAAAPEARQTPESG